MTRPTTFSPLSHERTRGTLSPEFDRVDDEFVFSLVVDDPRRDEDRTPLTHSLRVDPTEGRAEELVLHVTRRESDESDRPDRDDGSCTSSFTVTVPASGIGTPPRIGELEAALDAWYDRRSTADPPPSPDSGSAGTVGDTGRRSVAISRPWSTP